MGIPKSEGKTDLSKLFEEVSGHIIQKFKVEANAPSEQDAELLQQFFNYFLSLQKNPNFTAENAGELLAKSIKEAGVTPNAWNNDAAPGMAFEEFIGSIVDQIVSTKNPLRKEIKEKGVVVQSKQEKSSSRTGSILSRTGGILGPEKSAAQIKVKVKEALLELGIEEGIEELAEQYITGAKDIKADISAIGGTIALTLTIDEEKDKTLSDNYKNLKRILTSYGMSLKDYSSLDIDIGSTTGPKTYIDPFAETIRVIYEVPLDDAFKYATQLFYHVSRNETKYEEELKKIRMYYELTGYGQYSSESRSVQGDKEMRVADFLVVKYDEKIYVIRIIDLIKNDGKVGLVGGSNGHSLTSSKSDEMFRTTAYISSFIVKVKKEKP